MVRLVADQVKFPDVVAINSLWASDSIAGSTRRLLAKPLTESPLEARDLACPGSRRDSTLLSPKIPGALRFIALIP